MTESTKTVTVRVMDKDYKIVCPPEDEPILRETAAYVHQEMQSIRQKSKILSTERIAVLAALNLARELLEQPQTGHADDTKQLKALETQIDTLLAEYDRT
ncbi:MAG TPA: cell division protein ZapA [Halothiobacillaceae bacterium]|nr:cell division protein ZapA [Halothiobacillaceae bacterium]